MTITYTYTPYVHRCWHDGTCCRHCGHVPRAHHAVDMLPALNGGVPERKGS